MKVIGGRFAWLLGGHSSLCTDRRATSACGTIDSQELRTSMLASKLATARIFRYTPTTPNSLTVSRCRLGIYRCHDLKQQGQRHLPHYLRQRTHGRRLTDGIDRLDGLGFLTSLHSSFSFSHIGYYLNVFVWLWKIGGKSDYPRANILSTTLPARDHSGHH